MIDTPKLLYILPDVTYVVELVPGKKENTFSVQNFRQINGEFLNDDDFIAANIQKLFQKLEPDSYHVILPDFLFTNTIVTVKETADSAIKAHIKEKLLPSLDISTNTHEIATFVLTQYNNQTRVQLSALEKSALTPLRVQAHQKNVKITAISPISWSIKSIISLEPSISLVQLGSKLYSALHYIGVDQTYQADVSEVSNIAETIRTLKGAEPSIQTVYLLTNALVEEQLKEQLSNTLPLQQLAQFKEDDTQMPSYVRYCIESSMKTLSISDFPVPKFALGKPTEQELSGNNQPEENDKPVVAATELPAISQKPEIKVLDLMNDEEAEGDTIKANQKELDTIEIGDAMPSLPVPQKPDLSLDTASTPPVLPVASLERVQDVEPVQEMPQVITQPAPQAAVQNVEPIPQVEPTPSVEPVSVAEPKTPVVAQNLEQATAATPSFEPVTVPVTVQNVEPIPVPPTPSFSPNEDTDMLDSLLAETDAPGEVLPHDNNSGSLFKMFMIMAGAFVITVLAGVGIGFGIINYTQPSGSEQLSPVASSTPQVEASPEPTATPEPTPEPKAIDLTKVKVLVVNATTKAGYAGGTKNKLDTAKVAESKAANAKATYEVGTYLLLSEENPDLVAALEEVTELTFEVQVEGKEKEDTAGTFTAVIVLAE